MKDIFGKALLDYYNNQYTEDLITATSISSEDILPLPIYLGLIKICQNLNKKH